MVPEWWAEFIAQVEETGRADLAGKAIGKTTTEVSNVISASEDLRLAVAAAKDVYMMNKAKDLPKPKNALKKPSTYKRKPLDFEWLLAEEYEGPDAIQVGVASTISGTIWAIVFHKPMCFHADREHVAKGYRSSWVTVSPQRAREIRAKAEELRAYRISDACMPCGGLVGDPLRATNYIGNPRWRVRYASETLGHRTARHFPSEDEAIDFARKVQAVTYTRIEDIPVPEEHGRR